MIVFPAQIPSTGGEPAVEPQSWIVFQTDFPDAGTLPPINGQPVMVRRTPHPARADRIYTYWHMVTDGPDEITRRLDITRLQRIPWARPFLEQHTHVDVKRWWNTRGGLHHLCLWHPKVNYLLVIKQRWDGLYLITSYCPEPKRRLQFHGEWAEAKKAGRTF